MKILCVWEHNGNDCILYAENFVGAFTRGSALQICRDKMVGEIKSYIKWLGEKSTDNFTVEIVQEKSSELNIRDADTDVLFNSESTKLSNAEYEQLKRIALKSAQNFLDLYNSIPDKSSTCLQSRQTFYGAMPRTASEMYEHTKNVNSYYFGEIGVDVDNSGDILECRKRGFELLEKNSDFLQNKVLEGSYGELWSVRKVLRRFIWHDRIHAKAMYRMAVKTFGDKSIDNIFEFIV